MLIFKDGTRILVGKDCGKKAYGANFVLMERSFNAARERAYYLQRRDAALANRRALMNGLEELVQHESFRTFRDLKRTFNREMAGLSSLVSQSVARNGAMLTYGVKVRDIAAEERRDNDEERRATRAGKTWVPPKSPRPIHKMEQRNFGALVGLEFYRLDRPPDEIALEAIERLKSGFGALEKANRTADLRSFFKGASTSFEILRAQIARVTALPVAFSDANLALLSSWASVREVTGYSVSGRYLLLNRSKEQPVRLGLPPTFAPPTDSAIVDFELSLGGEVNTDLNGSTKRQGKP